MPLWANAAVYFGKSVHVQNAGTLSSLLTTYEKQNVEVLIISGKLNGSDIIVLQDMANASMISLDMSDADIVAGGSAYYTSSSTYSTWQYTTIKNVIGEYMFYGTKTLQEVILPNSATTIESGAFGYGSLKSMTIGPNVTSITAGLCAGTPLDEIILNNNSFFVMDGKILYNKNKTTVYKALASIEGDVSLPSSVTTIQNSVFSECNLRSITIPEKVTEIQTATFSRCPNLEEVKFNTRLTELGYSSFSHCPKLKSIDLSTTKITEVYVAFYNTTSLEEITFPSTLQNITASSITSTVLKKITCNATTPPTLADGNGNSFAYNNIASSCKVYVPKGKVSAYKAATGWKRFANIYEIGQEEVIPTTPGTKEINGIYYKFNTENRTALVTYKGTITGVGMNTEYNLDFKYYKDDITIPSTVTDNGIVYTVVGIGESAFYQSTLLKSIKLPDTAIIIDKSAFYKCTGLTAVSFGNSLQTICNAAFWGCSQLTNVILPASLSRMDSYAFCDCASLTTIELPSLLTYVNGGTFQGCKKLRSVSLGQNTEHLYYSAFGDCVSLTTISIPASVTGIVNSAFYGCTSLTDINVDATNTTYSSFNGVLYNKAVTHLIFCPQGKQGSYVIPSTVQEIGEHGDMTGGFWLCNKLTEVTIPNSVNFIGWMAFSGCNSLQKVISYIQTPFQFDEREFSTWENGAYQFCDATLYVPKGTKSLYQSTSAWNKFKMIIEMEGEEICSEDYLQQRLDEIAAQKPAAPVELTICPDGLTLTKNILVDKDCKAVITGGPVTSAESIDYRHGQEGLFMVYGELGFKDISLKLTNDSKGDGCLGYFWLGDGKLLLGKDASVVTTNGTVVGGWGDLEVNDAFIQAGGEDMVIAERINAAITDYVEFIGQKTYCNGKLSVDMKTDNSTGIVSFPIIRVAQVDVSAALDLWAPKSMLQQLYLHKDATINTYTDGFVRLPLDGEWEQMTLGRAFITSPSITLEDYSRMTFIGMPTDRRAEFVASSHQVRLASASQMPIQTSLAVLNNSSGASSVTINLSPEAVTVVSQSSTISHQNVTFDGMRSGSTSRGRLHFADGQTLTITPGSSLTLRNIDVTGEGTNNGFIVNGKIVMGGNVHVSDLPCLLHVGSGGQVLLSAQPVSVITMEFVNGVADGQTIATGADGYQLTAADLEYIQVKGCDLQLDEANNRIVAINATGIVSTLADTEGKDGAQECFDLSGRRVASPRQGAYILRQGGKYKKVYIK